MEPWNPLAPTYGRYRIFDEGNTEQERRVALGRCATEAEATSRLTKKMQEVGVLPVEEQVSASVQSQTQTPSFRTQAEWYIGQLKTGGIVSKKSGQAVQPTTVAIYQTGINYLHGTFIGDLPLASIDNPEAKKLIRLMLIDQTGGTVLRLQQNHSGILPDFATCDRVSRR